MPKITRKMIIFLNMNKKTTYIVNKVNNINKNIKFNFKLSISLQILIKFNKICIMKLKVKVFNEKYIIKIFNNNR